MKLTVLLSFILVSTFCFAQKKVIDSFICPPCSGDCDNITFAKQGKCSHCGMTLIIKTITLQTSEKSVCFYLQDGVEVLDFAGLLEIFTVAGFRVFIVSKTKDKIITQGTLTIIPDYSIKDAPHSDIMVFFGGNTNIPSNDTAVISWIQSRRKSTEFFLSVCTGAFIVGKAGILDSLTATTYHLQIDALIKALPKTKVLSNVRFVDNGNVITTAGISAGIDGALHLVEKLRGRSFAKVIARLIEYDMWIPEQGLIIKKYE